MCICSSCLECYGSPQAADRCGCFRDGRTSQEPRIARLLATLEWYAETDFTMRGNKARAAIAAVEKEEKS